MSATLPRPKASASEIDAHALRVVEFEGVVRRLEGACDSALGAALAHGTLPSADPEVVARLVATGRAVEARVSVGAAPSLAGVKDLNDALRRAQRGGTVGGQELYGVGRVLAAIREQKAFLGDPAPEEGELEGLALTLVPEPRLEGKLDAALESDGALRDGASTALATIRGRKKGAQARILERIQAYTTGPRRDALSDPIYTVRQGRYVVPVRSEMRGRIRGIVHDTSASGQTVFVEPEDVVEAANLLREIESAEREEEERILKNLSGEVGSVAVTARAGLGALARLDVLYAVVRLGGEMRGVFPEPYRGRAHGIDVRRGRHPLLPADRVVPVDIDVAPGESVLITGPNTGGKTVAMKMVGLFAAMAQAGMMVPADRVALAPFAGIWADIGDEQSLDQSLSTFSGHIRNISRALKGAVPGALVLLDEIGAGTDPAEGAALARALLLEFHESGAAVLASTHYGELKAFAFGQEGFQNASMEFDPATLSPTYRLVVGAAGASQALRIAERHGIERRIADRAREAMSENQRDVAEMLAGLENAQRLARTAQSRADRLAAELKEKDEEAARLLREAEAARRRAEDRARHAIETELREIRLQAGDLMDRLKKAGVDQEIRAAAREELGFLSDRGERATRRLRGRRQEEIVPSGPVEAGATVEVAGFAQKGTVLEAPRDGKALVQIGAVKMEIPVARLRASAIPMAPPRSASPARVTNPQKGGGPAGGSGIELRLIEMRAEAAKAELERFLDASLLSGVPFVRVLHGKGVLRAMVREALKAHREVESFEDAPEGQGGAGATVARFH